MKVSVYNLGGKEVGSMDVSDAIFGRKWNGDLVHQVVLAQAANERRPWAHAKGRGEVRGGGKKPWRQKGTGRARHGSIRSPLWKGGGVSHGPINERIYTQKINKKMLRAALYCVLSKKLEEGEIKFIDSMNVEPLKTKVVALQLKTLLNAKKRLPSTLLVPSVGSKQIMRAARNIDRVTIEPIVSVNITDLLKAKYVLVEQAAATTIK